jgi:hypothetical protein
METTQNTVQTIQKHSTHNTKHSKYKYTYYQNTYTIITKTRTCVLHVPPITPFLMILGQKHRSPSCSCCSIHRPPICFFQSEVQITNLKSRMSAPWFRGGRAPLFLSLGARWRWVEYCTSWSLFPSGKSPGTHWVGPWTSLEYLEKRKDNSSPSRNGVMYRPTHSLFVVPTEPSPAVCEMQI